MKDFSKNITLEGVEAPPRLRPPQFHANPFILPIMLDGFGKENQCLYHGGRTIYTEICTATVYCLTGRIASSFVRR